MSKKSDFSYKDSHFLYWYGPYLTESQDKLSSNASGTKVVTKTNTNMKKGKGTKKGKKGY
jgi:hypothetical protein